MAYQGVAERIQRCLRKEPRERQRDIGDARLELIDIRAGHDGAAPPGATTASARRAPVWSWVRSSVFEVVTPDTVGGYSPRPV